MNRMLHKRRPISGFTLVELLVVVLILSILLAVAIPLYLSSVKDAQARTCQSNMQTIATAVQAYHVRNAATDNDYATSISNGVDPTKLTDLQTRPTCPTGGTYSVQAYSNNGINSFKVNCTHHNDYIPGQAPPASTP